MESCFGFKEQTHTQGPKRKTSPLKGRPLKEKVPIVQNRSYWIITKALRNRSSKRNMKSNGGKTSEGFPSKPLNTIISLPKDSII